MVGPLDSLGKLRGEAVTKKIKRMIRGQEFLVLLPHPWEGERGGSCRLGEKLVNKEIWGVWSWRRHQRAGRWCAGEGMGTQFSCPVLRPVHPSHSAVSELYPLSKTSQRK